MKKMYVVVMLLFSIMVVGQTKDNAGAAASGGKEAKTVVAVSPKAFYGTTGVLINLPAKTNLLLEVRDKAGKLVYTNNYDDVQEGSFKVNLSALNEGKYTMLIKDKAGSVLYNEEIERIK